MDFDLQVAHSVKEIGKDAWDHLSAGRTFSSYRWYSFGEAALKGCAPTYITLSQAGEPIARATFWLKRQEWLPITSKAVRKGAERLLERWPLFACETPLACVPGLILPKSQEREIALEKIAGTARQLAKESRAACALFGYISCDDAEHIAWPKTYSAISYSDAETSLEIQWSDFESYIKQLAKSTRRNMRLHGKEAAEQAITINVQSTVPDSSNLNEAVNLIQNVETYHKVGYRPWTRTMLENGNLVDSLWISAKVGDRLVGCCSLYGDGGAMTATLLGLDYSFPNSIYVYYQLIYTIVRCAIENGCKVLYGGGGAYELKRRLGFQKLPDDYLMVSATGRFFGWLLRGGIRLVNPG